MARLRGAVLCLEMCVAVGACRSGNAGPSQAHGAGMTAAGAMLDADAMASGGAQAGVTGAIEGQAGIAGSAVVGCAEAEATLALGIAAGPVNAAPPLRLTPSVELLGDGLSSSLMPQQFGQTGLRWQRDRMYMLTDHGFWDIPVTGSSRWYPTPTTGVLGVRAADLDGDGDQDMMLLSMQMNTEIGAESTNPFVSRLAVWERTADGLVERSEVTRRAGLVLPIPYAFGDVDDDADLDIVGFEDGAPVGYINTGSFSFTRTLLGEVSADYQGKLVALVDFADRNQDGAADLLVLAGEALDVRGTVLLGDGTGKFGAPGPATSLIAALAPHGPTGLGFGIADVTGDGLADVLVQDPKGSDSAPILRLYVSMSATTFAPSIELPALGFEFADVDADGKTDIVTTRAGRLSTLLSRGSGSFERRELGVDMATPAVVDFVVDPGQATAPPTVRILYRLPACPMCEATCIGRCPWSSCAGCLSDADCGAGQCAALACVP
jgi:hypothetical protein